MCGIPILNWEIVFFIILGLKSVGNLIRILLIRNFSRFNTVYSIVSYIIIDGFYIGWLIYGNILFYSSKNDCNLIESTKSLYVILQYLLSKILNKISDNDNFTDNWIFSDVSLCIDNMLSSMHHFLCYFRHLIQRQTSRRGTIRISNSFCN